MPFIFLSGYQVDRWKNMQDRVHVLFPIGVWGTEETAPTTFHPDGMPIDFTKLIIVGMGV